MDAWLSERDHERGALLSFEKMWALVQPWYAGRMSSAWRGRSAAEAQAILHFVGLSGDFWRLA